MSNATTAKPLPIDFDKWRADGLYLTFQNHRIFYRTDGSKDKPVLLLIHGFPTASWDWHWQCPALTAQHHVVTFDMLGFGYSDKPKGYNYTMMEQADIAAALLRHLGIDRYHLIAHDYGVSVGQELIARHVDGTAQKILSVTMLNGGLFPEQHRPTLRQRMLHSPLGPLMAKLFNLSAFGSSFSEVFGPESKPSKAELQQFWQLINYNDGRQALAKLINYIDERRLHRERWVGALLNSGLPTRLINGPEDPVSGRHLADYYRQQVDNADIVSLPGIGHYPQVEAPEEVTNAILDFLNKQI